MLAELCDDLKKAQGRYDHVIAVVCDIRGFTNFSSLRESPEIATLIKLFYIKLLSGYFQTANYVKLTGDGMLLVFQHTDDTLLEVSKNVLHSCLKAVEDFPGMFKDDLMINFDTPPYLGFGIARGPAYCLYSEEKILDYWGNTLNLASRINEFARPKGVIIAGTYKVSAIPEDLKDLFDEVPVYIRSISEQKPFNIFYQKQAVEINPSWLIPIQVAKSVLVETDILVSEINDLGNANYFINLTELSLPGGKSKLLIQWPHPKKKDGVFYRTIEDYTFSSRRGNEVIIINMDAIKEVILSNKFSGKTNLKFIFEYTAR